MKTNEIQFGGKSYVCRIVEANDGEELLIAPTTLLVAFSGRTSKSSLTDIAAAISFSSINDIAEPSL